LGESQERQRSKEAESLMPFFTDKLNNYKKLSKFCMDNGLVINMQICMMIEDYLVKEGVIKK